VVRSTERDALQAFLKERGIHTMVHYPMPVHQQPAIAAASARFGGPAETDRAAGEILSAPDVSRAHRRAGLRGVTAALRAFAAR
jgi:dTDP-4-amino-4,6-dideoxygalactose transaminase